MTPIPELEILSDDHAELVTRAGRVILAGPNARPLIAAYRHCLSHPGTGETDAALYLWGLMDGMRYAWLEEMQSTPDKRH